ncbi:MAG: enoyl-CoA hydratase-related protein [Candidatus Palauibacterales bacterium]|nr:enoyl-CoA hydratase-related protein [Candidatus Palauibacterales bacterium]MDP2584435.1 enoyl-CoA hydratase-related protein [Candidatus Palauibacterales bacterium]
MSDVLKVEKLDGGVALLTVNRPDKMNALNGEVRCALLGALDELRDDDDVRVVVLTGAGEKAFIAGADIKEFEGKTPAQQHRAMVRGNIYSAMETFPKPVIAMINGYCLGGGCELSMACDIRVASDRARLGQPEINLGIIPGGGGTQRLPRLVGEGRALKLILSGEMVGAEEAGRIGLVDEVVPADQLRERTLELAREMASKGPIALQAAKECVLASRRMPLDEGLKFERGWFALLFSTKDMEEGVDAFLNKREAHFTGE